MRSIIISAKELFNETTFLVNTSAEINVIKKLNLYSNIKMNTNVISIAEITEGKIETIGLITIKYSEYEIQLDQRRLSNSTVRNFRSRFSVRRNFN